MNLGDDVVKIFIWRIRGFLKRYALHKSTFYLLTYFTYLFHRIINNRKYMNNAVTQYLTIKF